MESAKKIIEECEEVNAKIELAKQKAEENKERAQQRLKQLEAQFPSLLAAEALGELTEEELNEVRSEVSDLERVIKESPLAIDALETRERKNAQRMVDTRAVIKRHEMELEYQEKLAQIQKEYSRDLEHSIWPLATQLGKRGETEPIIKTSRDEWESRPLVETEVQSAQ